MPPALWADIEKPAPTKLRNWDESYLPSAGDEDDISEEEQARLGSPGGWRACSHTAAAAVQAAHTQPGRGRWQHAPRRSSPMRAIRRGAGTMAFFVEGATNLGAHLMRVCGGG